MRCRDATEALGLLNAEKTFGLMQGVGHPTCEINNELAELKFFGTVL
ncbi:hypothetical protein PC129_g23385 [Phytophthora cactorum]|uniref:Uncharacterized protein n=1 Tax=Phytophthora cactorum TaxID=29920 RepID=A0A8T1GYP3_9STRA|nr:hypothetical protein Pcac1_g17860 [Phytophthora cactorum]KAG2771308.1 hypothetical protein Pcac1_g17848 [Phytophthora cactorum]KAG2792716.1 hypothetical protein PC112_g23747 [Phytophthora cactorum]KAG2872254.1 hypothetical protein PC114_g26482 [Phytophthora cactorum]KAG2876503.1 hypothetical protein PC115_g23606 [Phytophthora cactorum]